LTDSQFAPAFLGTFESLRMGPTFARGRRDERAGHVRSLTISSSLVVALVRGPDDPKAFRSRIAVRAFGASDWARVEEALAGEARFTASLLAGRMPAGIAEVFGAAGLSLVPLSLDEVAMDCTCERWPMPCIHLAATTYALVRRFEEDPFGVFTWRGRSRDELLTHLRELRSARAVDDQLSTADPSGRASPRSAASAADRSGRTSQRSAAAPTSLEVADLEDISSFWGLPVKREVAGGRRAAPGSTSAPPGSTSAASPGSTSAASPGGASAASPGSAGAELEPVVAPPGSRPGSASRPDALLDQLDPPPLSSAGRPIVDLLRPAYLALPEE
jgi:uncharacterized Zn finger protein